MTYFSNLLNTKVKYIITIFSKNIKFQHLSVKMTYKGQEPDLISCQYNIAITGFSHTLSWPTIQFSDCSMSGFTICLSIYRKLVA
jgi:hypothetical protein